VLGAHPFRGEMRIEHRAYRDTATLASFERSDVTDFNEPVQVTETTTLETAFRQIARCPRVFQPKRYNPLYPPWKFYAEQMFVSVRMELRNHADTQPVKRLNR